MSSRDSPLPPETANNQASDVGRRLPRYLPALWRYARVLVLDIAPADDLVQDCVERALARAHLWRPTGDKRSWLFTIMHNLNANNRRHAATRWRLTRMKDDLPEPLT